MNPVGPPPPPFPPPPPPPAFPVSAFGPPAQFQGQPYGYAGGYGYQAPADGKAVASLVLGILSLLGCGALLAIPAVILGVLARRDAERSGGRIGGAGLALGGIVTGSIGGVLSVVWIGLVCAGLLSGLLSDQHPTPAVAPAVTAPAVAPSAGEDDEAPGATAESPHPSADPPAGADTPAAVVSTSIDVVVLEASTSPASRLKAQLQAQLRSASARGETVLVQTIEARCGACAEIDASLGDPAMEAALKNVRLVRIDVDAFEDDLKTMRMYEGTVPWFYKVDTKTARALDAIGADEWDDNVPANMAPVLGAFVKGTYATRRHSSPLGGTSL